MYKQPTISDYEKAIAKITSKKLQLQQLIDQVQSIIDTPDASNDFKIQLLRRHINDYNSQNS